MKTALRVSFLPFYDPRNGFSHIEVVDYDDCQVFSSIEGVHLSELEIHFNLLLSSVLPAFHKQD